MKRLLLLAAVGMVLALGLVAPAALAQSGPLDAACANVAPGTERPDICDTPDDNPITGTGGVILKAADLIALVAGVAAVFVLIIAGLQYITSAGEPNKVSGAKQTIIFTVVGLVIVLVARSVVGFIIRRF